jgi:DNA-binding response OmpR family regulator
MSPHPRFLIIDDDPEYCQAIETVSAQLGMESLSVADRCDAVLDSFKPTGIFLDLAMPGPDGKGLIGFLASRNYAGQVVLMSGASPIFIQMSSTIAETRGLNIAATLQKPFTSQQVLHILTALESEPSPTSGYRFLFLENNRIVRAVVCRANADSAAMAEASELLAGSEFDIAEVWKGPRCVGSVRKTSP